MKLSVCFGIFLTYCALAQTTSTIEVLRDRPGKTFLKSQNCKLLDEAVNALNKWAQRLKEPLKEKINPCHCQDGSCLVDITKLGPRVIQEFEGVYPQNPGPNCFNAALVSSNILPALGHATPEEMKFWMDSELCHAKNPGDKKEPGDIIRIRDAKNYNSEIHGFTYLTDKLAFSKNGEGLYVASRDKLLSYPYLLLPPDEVFNHKGFFTKKECQDVTPKQAKEKGCHFFAQTYSCISLDEYREENPIKDQEVKSSWEQLTKLDCQMSREVFETRGKDQDKFVIQQAIMIVHMLAQKKLINKNTKDHFQWNAISNRAESLRIQYQRLPKLSPSK